MLIEFIVVYGDEENFFYVVNHLYLQLVPATFLDGLLFKNANEMTNETFKSYSLYLGSIGYMIFDKCKVWDKINEKLATCSKYFYEISQSIEKTNKITNEYFILKWKHEDIIKEIATSEKIKFESPYESLSAIQRNFLFAKEIVNNDEDSLSVNILKKLKKSEKYEKCIEIDNERQRVFAEYTESFFNTIDIKHRNMREIYSESYYDKLIKLTDDDIFISIDRTTWLPIEDDVSHKEILDYFLLKESLYIFSVYYEGEDDGTITYKINRELKHSMKEIELNHYCSACRILFTLIDNNHKSLSEAFNGFANVKVDYKNRKERSEGITKLFNTFKYYENQWRPLDECIKKINNGTGFVNRNDLLHGVSIDVDKYICVKLLLLFVSLNFIKDELRHLSEIYHGFFEVFAMCEAKGDNHE